MEGSLTVARRFGENLRRLRMRTDLSQEELGHCASLHRTEIGLLERGARVPRLDTLLKLSASLGVRMESPLSDGISWTPGGKIVRPGTFTFLPSGERDPDRPANGKGASADQVAAQFGRNLRRARRAADLSQKKLADQLGMHHGTIGNLERGDRVVRLDLAANLAGELNVPLSNLTDGIA